MTRISTANYLADADTSFEYATDDNDRFDRNDVYFVARALEMHTHVAGRGLQIPSGGLAAGAVTSAAIAPGAVGTAALADDAVTAAKIAASAVGASEIQDGAVGTAELADLAVTAAKLAAGSIAGSLGYTPANKAGEAFAGSISAPSVVAGAGGISSIGPIGASDAVITNGVSAGQFSGGNAGAGSVAALSLVAGTGGMASGGPLSATTIIASGAVQGTQLKSTLATGTPPLDVTSTTVIPNLNADMVDGAHATPVPGAGKIPIADASGKIDGWVTAGGAGSVPSGVIAMFATAAAIASGWVRYSALDGRMPVGAGTTFGVTFIESTNYGSSWAHNHSASALGVGGTSGNASPTTGGQNVTSGSGSEVYVGQHTHDNGSYDVNGSTDDQTWAIPSRAVVFAQKS